MTCQSPPFSRSVYAEADRLSPRRARGADGTCPSAAHHAQNPNSDHEPSGPNNYSHAVDVTQSTPGSPDFAAGDSIFDAHAYGWVIAQRMKAGLESRVKYLVSFDGTHDVIFDPAVSMTWRPNATGTEHASHLHVSFTVAAEPSTAPFFVIPTQQQEEFSMLAIIVPGAHAQTRGVWKGRFPMIDFVEHPGGVWDAIGVQGARITNAPDALNPHGATSFNGMSVYHLGKLTKPIEGAQEHGSWVIAKAGDYGTFAIAANVDYV